MSTTNLSLRTWVEKWMEVLQPKAVHWCTGSQSENTALIDQMLEAGELHRLNEKTYPNCFLHRSDPKDVARVEHLTFVCTRAREDAGPNNNWMDPLEAHRKIDALFAGAMRGRTLYVVPYCMGPVDSAHARLGVQLTDSAYVVINMRIMTRMGDQALRRIESGDSFVKGTHSTGDLNPERRFIMHFPEEHSIKSFGSGYGGNALLGKKCHALRIASWQAREQGWLAEHMLIMGLQSPEGRTHYIAAAFPSACGKTNLAMLVPPASMPGWKIWTLGDDICWLYVGADGRLYAINPEAGYFGVVPGTNAQTNPNAYSMIKRDTIFTNVALTKDDEPWWEGRDEGTPYLDWQGRPYLHSNGPASHPNARFTVTASNNPAYSNAAENPEGVPISAILFGGRRSEVAPLVFEARNWAHGVLMGAGMASETTAAAVGATGVVRRDPMAMKPFCGYHFGDYWRHWLSFEQRSTNLPRVFHVNWFRKASQGHYLWPGFGDNLRVLHWIVERCEGRAGARETPIGFLPRSADLVLQGLNVRDAQIEELLSLDSSAWKLELRAIGAYLDEFGPRVPARLKQEHSSLMQRLCECEAALDRLAPEESRERGAAASSHGKPHS